MDTQTPTRPAEAVTSAPTQIFGERHAREVAAIVGEQVGMGRETYRQASKAVDYLNKIKAEGGERAEDAAELLDDLDAGRISISRLHDALRGDDRVPLYMKIPTRINTELQREADRQGTSRQELILALVIDCLPVGAR